MHRKNIDIAIAITAHIIIRHIGYMLSVRAAAYTAKRRHYREKEYIFFFFHFLLFFAYTIPLYVCVCVC